MDAEFLKRMLVAPLEERGNPLIKYVRCDIFKCPVLRVVCFVRDILRSLFLDDAQNNAWMFSAGRLINQRFDERERGSSRVLLLLLSP